MTSINCPHCGKQLEEPMYRFCTHCNGDISDELKIYKEKMRQQRIQEFKESEDHKRENMRHEKS